MTDPNHFIQMTQSVTAVMISCRMDRATASCGAFHIVLNRNVLLAGSTRALTSAQHDVPTHKKLFNLTTALTTHIDVSPKSRLRMLPTSIPSPSPG